MNRYTFSPGGIHLAVTTGGVTSPGIADTVAPDVEYTIGTASPGGN